MWYEGEVQNNGVEKLLNGVRSQRVLQIENKEGQLILNSFENFIYMYKRVLNGGFLQGLGVNVFFKYYWLLNRNLIVIYRLFFFVLFVSVVF